MNDEGKAGRQEYRMQAGRLRYIGEKQHGLKSIVPDGCRMQAGRLRYIRTEEVMAGEMGYSGAVEVRHMAVHGREGSGKEYHKVSRQIGPGHVDAMLRQALQGLWLWQITCENDRIQ